MDNLERAMQLLPGQLRAGAAAPQGAEEIRLRAGRRPTYLSAGEEFDLGCVRTVTPDDLDGVLERATAASVHAAENSVRRGYVTVHGGLRLGLGGAFIARGDTLSGVRRLSSVCIRIPREARGCCDGIFSELMRGGFKNTLILSQPGGGKTTCLRELIRLLSDCGYRVALCDDRGEVAAEWNGEAQFDLGARCDVISDAPKATGAMMLLRSMNPQILAMDEITEKGDVDAALAAVGCGVSLLATAHARDFGEFRRRPIYGELSELGVFDRAVIVSQGAGGRGYRVDEL